MHYSFYAMGVFWPTMCQSALYISLHITLYRPQYQPTEQLEYQPAYRPTYSHLQHSSQAREQVFSVSGHGEGVRGKVALLSAVTEREGAVWIYKTDLRMNE